MSTLEEKYCCFKGGSRCKEVNTMVEGLLCDKINSVIKL